jgi:hypothetical protein
VKRRDRCWRSSALARDVAAPDLGARYDERVTKKLNLPLFEDPAPKKSDARERKKPSIDAARARLGGRVTAADVPVQRFTPGVAVTFAVGRSAAARRMPGVVVFASVAEIHVLLDGIRLRRLRPIDLELHVGELDIELEKLAADARLFGQLDEGQSVRYANDAGDLVSGKVVEKCRWGALVLRDDGAIVAVGFRKLWPLSADGAA